MYHKKLIMEKKFNKKTKMCVGDLALLYLVWVGWSEDSQI